MNIYLICTGNTCRSPMAEAILRSKNIDNMSVRSAGIHTMDGLPISEYAKLQIEQHGMPYTPVSREVTADDIQWADHILTMTVAHKRALLALYPTAKGKVYTLKGFKDPHQEGDVQDPYGGDLGIYEQTFSELINLMDEIEPILLSNSKCSN